jgi:hypothetical protein
MKRSFFLFLIIVFSCTAVPGLQARAAAEPRRIALLPVTAVYRGNETAAVAAEVAETLAAWFRTPLSSIVPVYEIVPAGEIKAALPPNGALDPLSSDPARLKELSGKLRADLVLWVIITDLGRYSIIGRDGDVKLRTDLALRLVGYKADSRRTIDLADREDYAGDWSPDGEPEQLASVLTERLLTKAGGSRDFWPW